MRSPIISGLTRGARGKFLGSGAARGSPRIMENFAIIIPTYNERDNIRKLVLTLREMYPGARIYVVDDNSPDGTAEVVRELATDSRQVQLVFRDQKQGLASAYIDAFDRILPDETLAHVVTMDADLSHNPAELRELLEHADSHHVVIWSRYVPGRSEEHTSELQSQSNL